MTTLELNPISHSLNQPNVLPPYQVKLWDVVLMVQLLSRAALFCLFHILGKWNHSFSWQEIKLQTTVKMDISVFSHFQTTRFTDLWKISFFGLSSVHRVEPQTCTKWRHVSGSLQFHLFCIAQNHKLLICLRGLYNLYTYVIPDLWPHTRSGKN